MSGGLFEIWERGVALGGDTGGTEVKEKAEDLSPALYSLITKQP